LHSKAAIRRAIKPLANEADLLRICADDGASWLLWLKPTNATVMSAPKRELTAAEELRRTADLFTLAFEIQALLAFLHRDPWVLSDLSPGTGFLPPQALCKRN
jgi:hypothetical protein